MGQQIAYNRYISKYLPLYLSLITIIIFIQICQWEIFRIYIFYEFSKKNEKFAINKGGIYGFEIGIYVVYIRMYA